MEQIPDINIGKKISRASANNLFFLVLNSLAFVFLTPFVLKNLGLPLYGIWTVLLSFSQLTGLATLGTGSAVEKFIAQYNQDELGYQFSTVVIFGYIFMGVVGIVMSLLIWAGRYWIARVISGGAIPTESLAFVVGLISFSILPQFLTQVSRGIFLGLIKNFWAGFFDSLQNTGLWIGVLILSTISNNLNPLAWLLVGISWFSFIISSIILLKTLIDHRLHFHLDLSLIKIIQRQAFLTWFSSLGIMLFQNVDRILVSAMAGPGAAGVYTLATSVALRMGLLIGQFTQVLTPLSSRWNSVGKLEEIYVVYRKILLFSGWFLFFVAGLIVVWLPNILNLWISREFSSNNSIYFQILIVIYSLFSLVRPAHQVLTGMGRVEMPAVIFLLCGILSLILIAIGANYFGLFGATIGNLIYCSILILNIPLMKQLNIHDTHIFIELLVPCSFLILVLVMALSLPSNLPSQIGLTVALGIIFVITKIKNVHSLPSIQDLYNPNI